MADEVLILPVQNEIPVVETVDHAATRPAPTAEEQQASDGVFSNEQNQLASALIAAQMGLGLLHNLTVETFKKNPDEEEQKRRKPRPEGRDCC